MNPSRGTLSFHRLFSIEELGFRDSEPFVAPLIREFLKIGEAVAGRWIEMPDAILVFQMVADVEDSGAIYLYDRRRHVFYMLCFEGPDDHLTLQEFEQILAEYSLLHFAEQPRLAEAYPSCQRHAPRATSLNSGRLRRNRHVSKYKLPEQFNQIPLDLALETRSCAPAMPDEWYLASRLRHAWFQTAGSA